MTQGDKTPEVESKEVGIEEEGTVAVDVTDSVGDVAVENIEQDFDDDDEFYDGGGLGGESNWLNYIGIICFVLAGVIGVWQFWLSGVGKYEDKNQTQAQQAFVPSAPVQPQVVALQPELVDQTPAAVIESDTATESSPTNALPVEPLDTAANENAEKSLETEESEAVLPEVSVEMSEEDLFEDVLDEEIVSLVEEEKQPDIGAPDEADGDQIVQEELPVTIRKGEIVAEEAVVSSVDADKEAIEENQNEMSTQQEIDAVEEAIKEDIETVASPAIVKEKESVQKFDVAEASAPVSSILVEQDIEPIVVKKDIKPVLDALKPIKNPIVAQRAEPKKVFDMNSIEGLEAFLKENPNSAEITGKLANFYLQQNDSVNAVRYFKRAKSLGPSNPLYPYELAQLLEEIGNQEKALKNYQRALHLITQHGEQEGMSQESIQQHIQRLQLSN